MGQNISFIPDANIGKMPDLPTIKKIGSRLRPLDSHNWKAVTRRLKRHKEEGACFDEKRTGCSMSIFFVLSAGRAKLL